MQHLISYITKITFMAFFYIICLSPVWGVEVKDLYEIELPVQSDKATFNQSKLTELAFREVLIRVSGSEKILNIGAITQALKELDKYVSKVSFKQKSLTERSMRVKFNESLIKQLLISIEHPAWDKTRPLILVWLVINREDGPHWVGSDSEEVLAKDLEKILNQRAIPFLLPMLDLTDTAQVTEQDVLTDTTALIEQASQRYNPDLILMGHLSNNAAGWRGHWSLLKTGEKASWENTGKELSDLLNASVESLAAKLVGREFALDKPDETIHTLTISISGIEDAEQYVKVFDHLKSLPSVVDVEVAQVMPEKTIFNLKISVNNDVIVKAIVAGRILVENPTVEGQVSEVLDYKVAGISIK